MKVIGVTGGIGSGKSTVVDYILHNYSAYVIITDIVRASCILPGTDVYYSILDTYGNDVLLDGISVDRDKLYSKVFSNEYELKRYNNIIRPHLKDKVINTVNYFKTHEYFDFIVIESATLFEDELDSICDEIWYIHSDIKDRKSRLIARGDLDKNLIPKIISYQMMPSEYKKICNRTINNYNSINELYNLIDNAMERLF